MERKIRKIFNGILLGLLSALIIFGLSHSLALNFFTTIQNTAEDWQHDRHINKNMKTEKVLIEDIVIVDIDERSLKKLGVFQRWPRRFYREVITYLAEGGAALIFADLLFLESDQYSRTGSDSLFARAAAVDDSLFAHAVGEAGNVFLAYYFSESNPDLFEHPANPDSLPDQFRELGVKGLPLSPDNPFLYLDLVQLPFDDLLESSYRVTYVNCFPDWDGVIRSTPLFIPFHNSWYPSFALQAVMDLADFTIENIRIGEGTVELGNISIPVDSDLRMRILYPGAHLNSLNFPTFRTISFYDVLEHRLDAGFFQDKIVLIGTSAPGLSDIFMVPAQPAYPGVEIHASALYTILDAFYYDGTFISSWSFTAKAVIFFFLCISGGVIFNLLRPFRGLIVLIMIVTGVFAYGTYSFNSQKVLIDFTLSTLSITLTFVMVSVIRFATEEREKRKVKRAFGHYLSEKVVAEILADPSKLKLGGEKKILTILFSDIRGFTSISEVLSPEKLVSFLNEFFTDMTTVILENDGTLDKYMGDCIMAIFGAPVWTEDHSKNALRSAFLMNEKLNEFKESNKDHDLPPFNIGVGINSGEVTVGNMGSKILFDYTVIGDAVNLASRLEGLNKTYGTQTIVGETTCNIAGDSFFFRKLDLVRVKGKNEPVAIYELISEEVDSDLKKPLVESYENALELYRSGNFTAAFRAFETLQNEHSDDGPSKLFTERCSLFIEEPPAEDWEGVWTFKTK